MLYHITPLVNVSSILKDGLHPMIGDRSSKLNELEPAVYLFPDMDAAENAWMNWLGEELEEENEVALLAVELPPDACTVDSVGYEVVVLSVIPPSSIKVLAESLDEFDWQSPANSSFDMC